MDTASLQELPRVQVGIVLAQTRVRHCPEMCVLHPHSAPRAGCHLDDNRARRLCGSIRFHIEIAIDTACPPLSKPVACVFLVVASAWTASNQSRTIITPRG